MTGRVCIVVLLWTFVSTVYNTDTGASSKGAEAQTAPSPELCDLHLWYVDLVADGAFDGHLTAEQQGVKKRIESLIARTRGTPSAGRISCSTLTTFENILLSGDGPWGQGRKLEEMKRKEEEEKEEERKTEESTEKGKETKPVKEEQEMEEAEWKPEDSKEQGKEEKKLEKEEEERKPEDSNEKGKEEKKLEKEEEERKPEESTGKGNEEKKQVKEEEKEEEEKGRNLERKAEERKKNEEDEAGDSGNDTEEGLADDTKHSDIGTKDKDKTKEKDSSADESETKEDGGENQSTQDASIHTTADASLSQMKTLHNSRQTKAKQNTRLLTPMCQDRERKCHWSEQLIPLLSRPEKPRVKKQSRLSLFEHCLSPANSCLGKRKTKEQSSVHCYYYYLIADSGENVRYKTLPEREPMVRVIQRSCHIARKCSSRCFYGSHRQQCLQHYDIHSNQSQKRSAADTGRADDQETKPAAPGNLQTDDTEPLRSETETADTEADEDENDEKERNGGQETEEPAEDSTSETDDNKDEEAAEDDGVAKADGDDTHIADDTDIDDTSSETEQDEHSKPDEDESQEPKHDMTAKANKRKTSRHSETDEGDIFKKKNDGSDDARDSNSKSSALSKEDLLKLEALFQQKASEQAAKVQSLEILVMKLENQILAQKLTEQNGSSHIVHLENQILRIENELLKLNQSYLALHEENEVLKSRQNKYLALEHKSSDTSENRPALPSNSSKYFELVTMQQEKLATLSDLLGNQSSALHKLRLRSDKLEEQNQALYQIVMNQTALISHVMQKLQEVSEQNLKNRQETGQLKSALDMQSASYNLIHKLENMLDEASPRVGSPSQKAATFASSVLLDGSSSGSSRHQNVKFSHVLKFLPAMSGAVAERWKCEGDGSPSLCLLFTILLSPCPPFRTLSWSKCPYRLGQVESGWRRHAPLKDTEAAPLENGDILNEQGAFSGASSKHLNVDTWVLDTTRATQPQTKTEQAPAKREDMRPTASFTRDKEATNSEFSARTERSSAKDSSEHKAPPSGSKRLSERESESLPATSTPKDGIINSKEESNPLQTKDGKEAPDSVSIPALRASSPEPNTGLGTKSRGGKDDDSAEDSSASVPAKPPTSTVLPQALGATDGQKAESEGKKPEVKDTETGSKDKKTEGKGDSPERLKSTGVLPEAVNAIDDKAQTVKDTPEKSIHPAAKKATQGQQKTDEQKSPGSIEKTRAESTDSKKRGGEEQGEKKLKEEKMKAEEEEKRRKEEAEKVKKLEQQKREAEIMAKKMKAAETRVLAYWSADNRKPKDCYDLYKRAPAQPRNGAYKIFVKGMNLFVSVYCDMKAGGWTLLMKREDGSVDFYRGWDDYMEGFGTPFSEHYVGNEVVHYLTNQDHYRLQVDLMDWAGHTRTASYRHFWVDAEEDKFRLHVLGYNGTAGDGLGKHDGMMFSTKDQDNDLLAADQMGGSCARRFHGAGWYYKCYMSNLMGSHYVDGTVPDKRFDGVAWKPWTGPSYSLKEVVMKVRPREAG